MDSSSASRPTASAGARFPWLPIINALALAALWIFESRVGEGLWISGVLCYIPQHLVIVPTLILLLASIVKKRPRTAGLYAATLIYATHIFLGLQVPASTWSRDSSPPRLKVRAMTYNILGGLRGVENVTATIRAQDPDVLFVQEAVVIAGSGMADPVSPMRRSLPGYQVAREGEVCIFSRFPILAQRSTQFPDKAARFVLEAILDVRGVPVRVVTVHPYTITFRSPKYSFPQRIRRSLAIRNGQVATLLGVLEAPPSTWKREWREAPLLVAGDFNTPPRGRVYNAMSARLVDSWREAGFGMGNSYSASTPVVRIDYIWHSQAWRATSAFVPSSQASDHRPLVADLELR